MGKFIIAIIAFGCLTFSSCKTSTNYNESDSTSNIEVVDTTSVDSTIA